MKTRFAALALAALLPILAACKADDGTANTSAPAEPAATPATTEPAARPTASIAMAPNR